MSGALELGNCDVCQATDILVNRQYYYYDIKCDCCYASYQGKRAHITIVYHCNDCKPKAPRKLLVEAIALNK